MDGQSPPPSRGQLHFAVVGAGVAGLVCARGLAARGIRVTVFERSAIAGGRVASQVWEGGISDTGAQFLTARSEAFQAELAGWRDAGRVQPWEPGLAAFDQGQGNRMTSSTPCFVGVPSMLSIVEHLAQDIDIVFHAHVGRIARGSAEWFLFDGHERPLGIAGFDGLVLALPSVLALELVRGVPELAGALGPRLAAVQWDACWTASVVLSRLSGIEFDAAFIRDDPILVWAAREGSKPRRSNPPGMPERWLLQARASWSNNFARLAPDEAGRWMQRAFAARLARPLQQKSCYAVHWPQASPTGSLGAPFHWDAPLTFGLAGDWCSGASIESAFLSGSGVAQAIAS